MDQVRVDFREPIQMGWGGGSTLYLNWLEERNGGLIFLLFAKGSDQVSLRLWVFW